MFPPKAYKWERLSNNVDSIIDVLDINIDKIDSTIYTTSEQDSFMQTISSRDFYDLEMKCKCYKYLYNAFQNLSGEKYFIENNFIGTKFKYNSKESICMIAEKDEFDKKRMKVYVNYNYYNFGGNITFPQAPPINSDQDDTLK